jgi:protocatechuate 3,4-dioxygenase beta subunit
MKFQMNRRSLLRWGGLLAGGQAAGALTLASGASPTHATADAHNYLDFLATDGTPELSPASWSPSHADILGPYYAPGAPFRGKITAPLEPGKTLQIRGRVWSFTTKKPVPNTMLDVWQADAEGVYDKSEASDRLAIRDFRNRIRLMTDESGYFDFETVKPGEYAAGGGIRPSHIHFLVRALGHKQLVTQIYFKGDAAIEKDRFAKASNLILDLETVETKHGKYLRGWFDVVLEEGADADGKTDGKAETPTAYYEPSTATTTVLDQDGDGRLSKSEISSASKALRRLDANGDGALSPSELTPLKRPSRT